MRSFALVRRLQLFPNALLAALPPDEYERIGPDLITVELEPGDVLHVRDEPIRDVYFPHQGVYSMIMTMADGQRVEGACIGNEGMLGIHAFLGEAPASYDTVLQVGDGVATKMGLATFRREIQRRGTLHQLVGRYAQALLADIMQTSGCNRLHPLRQRCSRWLLETHDRIHRDEFQLSHEFLAAMLGVHRPTVTVIAGALQKAGLIRYRHGHITVIDRAGLESVSCECYATIRGYFDRCGEGR